MLYEHRGNAPTIHPDAYVAPSATIVGDVRIEAGARILHGAVLSAEDGTVGVGRDTVVMENTVVRGRAGHPALIGDAVMVGPPAHVNGSTIGDEAFIAAWASLFPGQPDRRWRRGAHQRRGAGELRGRGWLDRPYPLDRGRRSSTAFAPDQHDAIDAIQRALHFPGTVYGVTRDVPVREVW